MAFDVDEGYITRLSLVEAGEILETITRTIS